MFCRFGSQICCVLRLISKVLCTWLDVIDSAHDRIYCSHCEPTYIRPPQGPQKGDLLNESEC